MSSFQQYHDDYDAQLALLGNYKYSDLGYPMTGDRRKATIRVTPISTIAPNDRGENPLMNSFVPIPGKQTVGTCIMNAADYASQYLSQTDMTPPSTGSFQSVPQKVNINDTINNTVTYTTRRDGLHYRIRAGAGYDNDVTSFFATTANLEYDSTTDSQSAPLATDFTNLGTATHNKRKQNTGQHVFAVEWVGNFVPDKSGSWRFYTNSDDMSLIWIGATATSGFTIQNALVNNRGLHGMRTANGTVTVTAGQSYPIRIHFSENWGGYDMQVWAVNPDGQTIRNFTGLFFVETTNTVTQQSSDVREVDLSQYANRQYTAGDPTPVYVAMTTTDSTNSPDAYTEVQCLINPQSKSGEINTVLAAGNMYSKYGAVKLWEYSPSMNISTLEDAYGAITSDGNFYMSDSGGQKYYLSATQGNFALPISGDIPPYSYMFLRSEMDVGGKMVPMIGFVRVGSDGVASVAGTIQLTSDSGFMNEYNKTKKYQVQNPFWISSVATKYLAYNGWSGSNGAGSYNTKLTNTKPIYSQDGMFRLIVMDGKLQLQMAIYGVKEASSAFGKLPIVNSDVAPNTYSVLKVDTTHSFNQMHMIDKSANQSYFVPAAATKLNERGNFIRYETDRTAPANLDGATEIATDQECRDQCKTDNNCMGFYSFTQNGKTYCKKRTKAAPSDYIFSNPLFSLTSDDTIPQSSLYVKIKEIPEGDLHSLTQDYYDPDQPLPNFSSQTFNPQAGQRPAGVSLTEVYNQIETDINGMNNIMNQPVETFLGGRGAGREGFTFDNLNNGGQQFDFGVTQMQSLISAAKTKYTDLSSNDTTIHSNYSTLKKYFTGDSSLNINAIYNDLSTGENYKGNFVRYNNGENPLDPYRIDDRNTLGAAKTDGTQLALDYEYVVTIATIAVAAVAVITVSLAMNSK